MIEREIEIATPDGIMNMSVCHPDENGPFPVVFLYMDAPGIRQELRDMAMRIGTVGYYVCLPNLYYRTDRSVDFSAQAIEAGGEVMRNAMLSKVRTLTFDMTLRDTRALLEFIDREPHVLPEKLGAVGYCMSGRWVLAAAAAYPDRFKAIASIFGTGLVTEAENSPHLKAHQIRSELYFAFAEKDQYVPPHIADALSSHLRQTKLKYRIEIHPETSHGFTFDRGHYHRQAAERHWERLFDLFRRNLQLNG